MTRLHITPQRVAPYLISGATGVHILARLRRAHQQPPRDIPLHFFLLRHTDIVLTFSGASVALWHIAKHQPRQQGGDSAAVPIGSPVRLANKTLVEGVVHQLRQIFTSLLLGLGLIDRKADAGDTPAIHGLVKRLVSLVHQGIESVNVLDAAEAPNGREKEYGG